MSDSLLTIYVTFHMFELAMAAEKTVDQKNTNLRKEETNKPTKSNNNNVITTNKSKTNNKLTTPTKTHTQLAVYRGKFNIFVACRNAICRAHKCEI